MEINKHIAFRLDEAPGLIHYLLENNIEFQKGHIISTLDIYESNLHWHYISKYVEQEKLLCSSETVFSKEELCNAKWMRVWCQWRCGYPQPENTFIEDSSTYSRENYCSKCGYGEKQIGDFRMKKVPQWGKRHFAELNWIGDELFLSETAKTILEGSGITGISFRTVKNKSGQEILPDVYQLVVPFILGNGMIEEQTSLKEISVCSVCGQKKYVPSGKGMLVYRKEIFEHAPDVVKSAEIFGSVRYAVRDIIIRQNVYQAIIANHLERGLVFEPIELI